MLNILNEINKISQELENNPQVSSDKEGNKLFRIVLKIESMIEVFVQTNYTKEIENLNFGENVFIYAITPQELEDDHYFSGVFNMPNKINTGLTWRFDTLLSNNTDNLDKKIENPCNIVTFYSYKGGMGRTTTLCAYATHLALNGKKVVILDCDFEAPGFVSFFRLNNDNETSKNGLVEYLLDKDFLGKDKINLKEDYLLEAPKEYTANGGKIYVMPAGNLSYANAFNDENSYFADENLQINLYHYIHGLARLNLSNTHNMLTKFRDLFSDLKQTLVLSENDYILIDSRTGFNEIFGITALNLSDVIVGFFGSSEQTRAGLYFLLDKYQAIQPQPKLMLVNSIVPKEEQQKMMFSDGFKRLLQNYKDQKESEWDILGSTPNFYLSENKVLKEIGVQFYEQEDKNQEKEKEFITLIEDKKYKYESKELIFEDLEKIFIQINEFTNKSPNMVFDVNNLGIKELRDNVLINLKNTLDNVELFAEDSKPDINPNTFFYRDCMKELFDKKKFIIQGFKGSGKTYLYKALKNEITTKIILEKSEVDNTSTYQFVNVLDLKDATTNYKKFPFSKEEVNTLKRVEHFWKVYMWASIMLDTTLKINFEDYRIHYPNLQLEDDINTLKEISQTGRKTIFEKYTNIDLNLILIEKDLENLNKYLHKKDIKLFVLFDQLDKVANPEDWGKLITPLVEFWRDNYNQNSFSNIFPKIFIRTDIIKRILTINNSLSVINTSTIKIEWTAPEMYAYFFKLIFSIDNSKKAFFKLMEKYQQYSIETIEKIQIEIENDKQPKLKIELINALLNTFFGSDIKSPSNLSLGTPYQFFFMNFSNADGTISLRPFLNLIKGSVENGLKNILPNLKQSDIYTEKPIFPQFKDNPPFNPILHYCYTTNADVRDKATEDHFGDLTQEEGNQVIKDTINYIKDLPKGHKYKKNALTHTEMDELLQNMIDKSVPKIKETITDIKKLLTINGIIINDEKFKMYRFAQMYKYWLGLSSRSARPEKAKNLIIGQKMNGKITSLNLEKEVGYILINQNQEVFFNKYGLIDKSIFNTLKKGDNLLFEISQNHFGFIATKIGKV